MKHINTIYKTFLLVCMASIIYAQPSFNQYKEKGIAALKNENFYGAISYFSDAKKLSPNDSEIIYLLGKSAYNQHAYNLAFDNLSYLVDSLDADAYPDAIMLLGSLSQTRYDYEAASRYADLYLSMSEGDIPTMTLAAKDLKKSADWAMKQDRLEEEYAKIIKLEDMINSPYSEHAALKVEDKLYYTSMKYNLPDDIYKPNRKVSRVLSRDVDFYKELSTADKFNGESNFSSGTAISTDGNTMFTSICSYVDLNDISCEIYRLTKDTQGDFVNPVRLPEVINSAGSSSTQPALGQTLEGKTAFFFSSNKEGGKGGMDLYVSDYDAKNDRYSKPTNLSELNTVKDDITPYFDLITNTLYFSTDGRDGFGGHDVFSFDGATITNQGYGVNSSFNDIYYSVSNDGKETFLSSNRPGSNYLESSFETCCYDIYTAEVCTIDLLALLFDGSTQAPIQGGSLTLKNIDTGISQEVKLNEIGNDFSYIVDCDGNYEILAEREGYQSKTISITSDELKAVQGDLKLEKKIYLDPAQVKLMVSTLEKPSDLSLLGATVLLIDTDTGETIAQKTNDSGNVFDFAVEPGKNYKIVARKGGYEEEMMLIDVPATMTGDLSKTIYLGKKLTVQTLADLLPIKLYFDNDKPDSRTLAKTTQKSYNHSYNNYYPRKETYERKYTGYFNASTKSSASNEVRDFFENDLRAEREKLNLFMDRLNSILLTGKSVNLFLRGFASPLSASEYNTNLGKRRVDCVRNEFKQYKSGILMKYISSGQLKLTERSFGETSAPPDISDDPRNPSKSIYSPRAARERRVEIEELEEIK